MLFFSFMTENITQKSWDDTNFYWPPPNQKFLMHEISLIIYTNLNQKFMLDSIKNENLFVH